MRTSKILALSLISVCFIATSVQADSRDRNPKNGDELIGYVAGGTGAGMEVATGMASIAANMLGVRIPGLSSQAVQPSYRPHQTYGGYQRNPGAPAYDFYADCRYRNGEIDRECALQVNYRISQAAREQGETFICKDRRGNLFRTQDYSSGCRLEANMTGY